MRLFSPKRGPQKVWIPQGTTQSLIEINGIRKSRRIFDFYNLKTEQGHAFTTERPMMYETATTLRKICKIYPRRRFWFYETEWGWHSGSVAQEALAGQHIKAIHSPDLNPQEHVWKNGSSAVTHNRIIIKTEPATKELYRLP